MKGRQVVLGHLFGLEAAALMQDGHLIDLLVASDPLTALAPGAICRASTDRFMKGQGGVFLRLPDDDLICDVIYWNNVRQLAVSNFPAAT